MPITKSSGTITYTEAAPKYPASTGVFDATQFTFADKLDPTKQMKFDCSGITADSTVTVTPPSTSGTMATLANTLAFAAPLTGATLTPTAGTQQTIIKPAGTIAELTITLPATPANGTVLKFASTQIVTTLTVNSAGADTVANALAAFAAGGFFEMTYRTTDTTWYRTG